MRGQLKIRFAKANDINQIIELCKLHAIYEKAVYHLNGKAKQLEKDLFGESPKLTCIVAEKDTVLLGYATYMAQYSTWDTKEYIYMDCLFVREFARGMGIGEKLVRRIQENAKLIGCHLLQWQTPDFNTRAIKFYRRLGATSKSKERFFLTQNIDDEKTSF